MVLWRQKSWRIYRICFFPGTDSFCKRTSVFCLADCLQYFHVTGSFGVSDEQSLAMWMLACVVCEEGRTHRSWCFLTLFGFSLYIDTSPSPGVIRLQGCLSWVISISAISSLLLHKGLVALSFIGYHQCMLERLWGQFLGHAWAVFFKGKTVISYFSDELSSDGWFNPSKSNSRIIWLMWSSMCMRL